MASGAEHDLDRVERDRLLDQMHEQGEDPDRSPWYAVQTRPHGPGETTEVLLNVMMVESITHFDAGSGSSGAVGWGKLRGR
jgi:hypothetical protein